MASALRIKRWRVPVVGLVVLVSVLLALGTEAGRGTAAELLAQFRSERLEGVSLSTSQIVNVEQTLSDLEQLGSVSGFDAAPQARGVATVEEASLLAGFAVLQPDPSAMPAGFAQTHFAIRYVPAHEVRFTLELDKARAFYQSMGYGDVNLPDHFDGASLVVSIAPAVLIEYQPAGETGNGSTGLGLVVGQSGMVTAGTAGGVTLDEMRDFLLGLRSLSPETAQALREIDDWRATLPIPIPVSQINWERAEIAGNSGLLLNDNTGVGSAAVWHSGDRIFGIAGAVKAQEIKRVAESLR